MKNEKTEKDTGLAWLKKHADTMVILGGFALAFWNLNEKVNDGFSRIENRLTKIETVLIVKNIMPLEMCKKIEDKVEKPS